MANGLSISDVVNVTVDLAPIAATYRNFGALMVLGDSNVIDVSERFRQYSNIEGVVADFGLNAPEYSAAQLFFSQAPKPALLYIGRYASSATGGLLYGAPLTTAQQALSNFTSLAASAGMVAIVDGKAFALNFNLTGAVSLNNVAAIIQTALQAAPGMSAAQVVWDANYSRFEIKSPTTGANSTVGYAQQSAAVGSIAVNTNPAPSDTVTIQGTVITFVSTPPVGSQVLIGASPAETATNLYNFLIASANVNIVLMNYMKAGTTIYAIAKAAGTAGNTYTLAKTGTGIVVSGATLAGGATATNVNDLMRLTMATGAPLPVPGVVAETPLQAVALFADITGAWYGLTFAASVQPTDNDNIAVAGFIEAAGRSRIFGITSQDPACLDAANSNDIGSRLKALSYKRTFVQYSSYSPYAVASMYGRAFTVNFEGSNTTLTMKFKQEPGVASENLRETQYRALKAKHINVFVQMENDTSIIVEGTMINGYFFDEVHGTDWLQNAMQTDIYNLLYQSATKVPQTDEGTNLIVNVMEATLERARNNGLIASGVWNADGFGQLQRGDTLTKGYYVYAPPVASQPQAIRETRQSVAIQAAIKLAGAVHFVGIAVTANR